MTTLGDRGQLAGTEQDEGSRPGRGDVREAPRLPLRDVRILELGGYVSAPYGTSLLCALGAEVVKVERPGHGDDFRRLQDDRSRYFIQYNAGKRSLAVDLKHPEGVALVKDLLPAFDVVVENMRPGKLAALGLGPEECLRLRPDLVYTSVTGFGEGGPLGTRPAYDTIGQAFGGLYSVLSDAGQPQLSGAIFGDLVTGLTTATGVLAALVGRSVDRTGVVVQTSIMEAVSTVTVDALTQFYDNARRSPSRETRHPQALNFVVRTADEDHLAVHLSSSQKFWVGLAEAIDRPDLLCDQRFADYGARTANYFQLVPIVVNAFALRGTAHWERVLAEHDVPFAPVLDMATWSEHPQVQWLDLVQPDESGVALLRPPWRFGGSRPVRDARVPRVGADTRAIANEVYDEARIDRLVAMGVLGEPGDEYE